MSAIDLFKGRPPDKKPGELARMKVLKGKDLGAVFVIKQPKVTIGRGEGVDILISDIKSSRIHSALELGANKNWTIRDLGSANGIILNGKLIRTGFIKNGDLFQIGDTLFEFFNESASIRELIAPVKPTLVKEVFDRKIKSESEQKVLPKRSNIVLLAAVFFAIMLFFSFNNDSVKKKTKSLFGNSENGIPDLNPSDKPIFEKQKKEDYIAAERLFAQGFREYVEKNYLRAYYEFEKALSTDPKHTKAKEYQKMAGDAIYAEVKERLARASLNKEIGNTQEVIEQYEAIVRLLSFNKSHSDYSFAEEELKKLREGSVQ